MTSSPYSLYGLGSVNQTGIGRTNGMGYSGIGLKTEDEIDNLNAANFALIPQNSFFYNVGLKGQYNNYSNKGDSETMTTINFSNLAMAFRIAEGLGAGIVMVPYSDVGYSLVGIQSNIEGTNETFESNVTGIGGLSDLRVNLGYRIIEGLRVGASASILFGNIEEEEEFQISNSSFNLSEKTNYTGLRFGLGMQFDLTDNITLGSTVQFPTALKGNLKRSVLKNLDGLDITVEDEEADSTADFNMPFELGLGLSAKIRKSLTLSADYKKNYWDDTGQTENIGSYSDQDIYAIGIEFAKDRTSYKYGDRIQYRAGFNYDTGYLSVNGTKIDGYGLTAGVGFPIGQGQKSMINLSYSYGSKGQIQNILIKENFHLLTLNLSMEDLWFQKRKID
ncbi:OmpP1/FadL family transporter [Pricia antarctica]|uniref:OmpP1/FadL family transporter n=1 Tax=Pricia antarctica TaxID=641691 RepID=UPI001FDFE9D1|nr:outer membrane protein transport protein [Pricia antarctica]